MGVTSLPHYLVQQLNNKQKENFPSSELLFCNYTKYYFRKLHIFVNQIRPSNPKGIIDPQVKIKFQCKA